MAIEAPKPKKSPEGLPAWMGTFADMMSLLLCFFVLLLTFSEIDAAKFKETSGSLKMAFGVQRDERFDQVPMGTSLVAQEYSPGQQQLMDFDILGEAFKGATDSNMSKREQLLYEQDMKVAAGSLKKLIEKTFKAELASGQMVFKALPEHKMMLQIPSRFIFQKDSSQMNREYIPTLIKVARITNEYVAHTGVLAHLAKDTKTPKGFRSKWDYTATQAAAMVDTLVNIGESRDSKFLVMAHADTRPENPEATEDIKYSDRIELILIPDANVQ